MSSTYSTNLGIELPGTGDQAGTWGTTTNTNLGTLIEQAISGYTTQAITDGADTVITIPNGASGTARNMYIELTGTLSAARNLIVPANKKLYFIYNHTSAGYAVTVKVSGQTGVVVPNGKKMLLVCNGTDIVDAVNYVAGGGLVVTGLGSSTDNAIARWDGTTGQVIQNSSAFIDDSGNLTATLFIGSGASINSLNASNFTTGTMPTARLPTTVAYTDASVLFTNLLRYGPSGGTAQEVGFRDIPRIVANANDYKIIAAHRGCYIDSAGFANVVMGTNVENGMPLGSAVAVYNNSASNMTISSTDTLRLQATGTTGTRTLAQRGWATLIKVNTTEWLVMGAGVS